MAVRERVLILCTGNSCRSQMAEGLLPSLHGNCFEALSAGAKPAGYVHPRAVTMLAELGIDIRSQTTKSILDFLPPQRHFAGRRDRSLLHCEGKLSDLSPGGQTPALAFR